MTPNENKVLMKFNELKQVNTVTIAQTLRVTINYACDVCNKLCENGYLERLSRGRFASYKITSLGETQAAPAGNQLRVRDDSPLAGVSEGVEVQDESETPAALAVDNEKSKEEYECVTCGALVKEENTVCPQCGVIFEEGLEEEATGERNANVSQCVPPAAPVPSETVVSSVEKADSQDKQPGILDHPAVPEDWKTCNWKWK